MGAGVRDHTVGVARLVLLGAVALFVLAGGSGSEPRAGAVGGNAGPLTVTVDKTADGSGVTARAEAPAGVLIYEIVAHYCLPLANIRNTFDFGFQGRKCTSAPVGDSDTEQKVEYPDGAGAVELPYFRFGVGTTRWVNSRGYDQEITCGPGRPCDVVIQLQITDGTVYFPATVCFDEGTCPAGTIGEPPPPPPPPPPADPPPVTAPAASESGGAPSGSSGGSPPTTTVAAASGKGGGDGSAGGAGASSSNGDPDAQARSAGITLSATDAGPSQATRVRAAAIAGVAGGVLIVGLISRGRRRMEEVEPW